MEPVPSDGTTSGNALGSICPQGWTLPPNAGDGSYYNLLKTTYGISTGSTLITAPFDFTYTGYYWYSSGGLDSTSYGYYWSRTAGSATDAYDLYFASGNVLPQLNSSRGNGRPVRCVTSSCRTGCFWLRDEIGSSFSLSMSIMRFRPDLFVVKITTNKSSVS